MKKPFETYLALIEGELGYTFFDWQKDTLRSFYDGTPVYCHCARGCGMTALDRAIIILCTAIEEDKDGEQC